MQTSAFIKKTFFALALAGYIGMTVFGVLHIAHMATMGMPMENCPFAVGEHALCEMNAFDHISAWQSFSTALLPTVKMLLLVGVIFVLFSFAYHAPPATRLLLYLKREWIGIVSLYQLLFSKGILNPKIP